MDLERLFERFRYYSRKPELPQGLSKEAGEVFAKSAAWADKRIRRQKLSEKPFLLAQHEIDVIQTRMAELRSGQLLGKMRLDYAPTIVEIDFQLKNHFRAKYDGIAKEVAAEYSVTSQSEIVAIENYLNYCQGTADFLAKEKSNFGLSQICSKIRGKRPTVSPVRPG